MAILTSHTLNDSQQRAFDKWLEENEDKYSDQCPDNHRFATQGCPDQEDHYDMLFHSGCCGFVDVDLECDDGTVLKYGFNYGH